MRISAKLTLPACFVLTLVLAFYFLTDVKKSYEAFITNSGRIVSVPGAPEPQIWQNVDFSNRTHDLVFSAFIRNNSIIVISIYKSPKNLNDQFYCQFWLDSQQLSPSRPQNWTNATFYIKEALIPGGGYRYSFAFYICSIPTGLVFNYISVVTEPCAHPSNVLKVLDSSTFPDIHLEYLTNTIVKQNTRSKEVLRSSSRSIFSLSHSKKKKDASKHIVNFTVCVPPLQNSYNDVYQLVETIETSRIFGAERFVFYNYSMGSDIAKYLESYIADGIVELIQWQLPREVSESMHYVGQKAAINDCLYRFSSTSRLIVFSDLDEIIVPTRHKTWNEMLESATKSWVEEHQNKSTKRFPGSFVARHTLFRNDLDDNREAFEDPLVRKFRLNTQLKTLRDKNIEPNTVRSKYIVWPQMVRLVGVHLVFDYTDNSKIGPLVLSPNDALLHHYRPISYSRNKVTLQNNRMHAFRKEIISRVSLRHNKIDRH